MKISSKILFVALICAWVSTLCHPHLSRARERCETWAARMIALQGMVDVQAYGSREWISAKRNDTFCPGDKIRVREKSRALLALAEQPLVRLDQNSVIILSRERKPEKSFIELLRGAAHFFSRFPNVLRVKTAFINAGVEGTEFVVATDERQTYITVFEGRVNAMNGLGFIILTDNMSASAGPDHAPVQILSVHPRDMVQWALYYPSMGPASYWDCQFTMGGNGRERVDCSSYLLSVGRVEEARAMLDGVRINTPEHAEALALTAIIAIAEGKKDNGLFLAEMACEHQPDSIPALLALSQALQASFLLPKSLEIMERVVRLEPDNVFALVRLAELYSANGQLKQAEAVARRAVELNPDLARSHTILGFIALLRGRSDEAFPLFLRAIMLDQADPMARFGLGLTKIGQGALKDGRKHLEISVALDPGNSLLRSYLAKAYFEENFPAQGEEELRAAQRLDPNDPTPWLYNAVHQYLSNEPVRALDSLNRAKHKNDNRPVYRSRMLLDSDLAVENIRLASVYHRLGFTDQALSEGSLAADQDPDGFAPHRFLSDAHANIPRHEIARVSELLQAQLLQPVNVTPIRPSSGESELFAFQSYPTMDPAHNEFSSMFNRDRISLLLDAMVGEQQTTNGETVLTLIRGNFSLSGGYLRFKTDGFRPNNDQEEEIADFFAQWAISPATSLQAEYRYRDTMRGDLSMLFNEWDFNERERRDERRDTYRIGLRHRQAPGSTFLLNLQHQESNSELSRPLDFFSLNSETDASGSGAEFQHILSKSRLNVLSGIGFFHIDGEDTDLVKFRGLPLKPFTYSRDTEHLNAYLYGNIHLADSAILTAGASHDRYDSELKSAVDGNQLNPKLGISWTPFACTTIRAALFRTWKRTLLTDQTLEKTHIAGFNQFYNDIDATDAWLRGVTVEQRFSPNLSVGLEYHERDLSVPYQDPSNMKTSRSSWDEEAQSIHMDWTPSSQLALTFHHRREEYQHSSLLAYNVRELQTEITGGRATFIISPYHLSLFVAADYYDQEGDFEIVPGIFEPGSDSFPLVDIGIHWPLPKRKGMLSMGVTNLFNEEFEYYEIDDRNPSIQPAASAYIRCSLLL